MDVDSADAGSGENVTSVKDIGEIPQVKDIFDHENQNPQLYRASQNSNTPSKQSRNSTTDTTTSESSLSPGGRRFPVELARVDSPLPEDEISQERKNEHRYRNLLQHEHHQSRECCPFIYGIALNSCFYTVKLPLWDPSLVKVGDVGYLEKPRGAFVKLFNAFTPPKPSGTRVQRIPSIHGYGEVTVSSQKQNKRTVAQRGIDALQSMFWPLSTDTAQSIA